LAEARAGGGSSSGSRGSMTYSAPPSTATAPSAAQPMQRSMTPSPSQPGGAAAAAPSARSGLMGGLMGGLIGVGIGGLLFGHGFMGGGMGFLGFIGLLLQIALVFFVVRFLYRYFVTNRSPALAGGPGIFARNGMGGGMPNSGPSQGAGPMGGGSASAAHGAPPPITVTPADYQEFEKLLQSIQYAWSAHDLAALRDMATPEMTTYFEEQIAEQAGRGVRNTVTDVRLESGDLSQAWNEQGRDYATVAMRFSMIDVTRNTSGQVVDGNATERATATEIWTFVRPRGGRWILSAIQQTR
jgi:predicted lipid-binding transport protein (Tim44 family)